jgi:hypothetical protein
VKHLERHYVKGHQDAVKKPKDLTQPKLWNIDADESATTMRFEMQGPASHVIPFPTSMANIFIQRQLISSARLDMRLHEKFAIDDYWEYLEVKHHWSTATRTLIAWDFFPTHTIINVTAVQWNCDCLRNP